MNLPLNLDESILYACGYVMDAHSRYFKINIDVSSVVSDCATNDANWQEDSQSQNNMAILGLLNFANLNQMFMSAK